MLQRQVANLSSCMRMQADDRVDVDEPTVPDVQRPRKQGEEKWERTDYRPKGEHAFPKLRIYQMGKWIKQTAFKTQT